MTSKEFGRFVLQRVNPAYNLDAFNVYIPAADGWRDLFRERPGFYEWVEAETFEGGRFKAFRADTNGNGDAWRDAELKPVSPPLRWRPLPTPKKARRDDE